MKKQYGQGAIAQSNGSHHNWGNIGYYLSAKIRFMDAIGTTGCIIIRIAGKAGIGAQHIIGVIAFVSGVVSLSGLLKIV